MKTASALLSKGYFPRELPLVFTTADFGIHHADVIAEWIIVGLIGREAPKKNRGSFWYKVRDTEAEVISTPKRGYERRFMHVTHPVPQALLATEIGDNWSIIWKWLQRTAYTLDEIAISDNFDRSVKGIDFRLHETKKDFIESTSDWLVRTDISRFYPSIYTHSIPWGAYGKSNVKDKLPRYNGSLADRLDRLVRACNRNQTIGIPIGPETSRIIAEIISSGVDQILVGSGKMPVTNLCDRLQDDWFVGLPSFEECEGCLGALIEAYRQFGLEINGQKTSVKHILSREKIGWRAELLSYFYSVRHILKGARLKDFLGMALRLQARHPNERIMSYFISLIEDIRVSDDDVPLIESFFLEAVAVAPIATDRICQMLINTSYSTKRVSKTRVLARCLELCEKALAQGNMYEAIWLLYTLRGLDIKVSSKIICDNIEGHEGSCFPLILLDMQNKGKFAGKLPIAQWENWATPDRVERDWLWLLAYEGIRHGWLQDRHAVMNDRLFAPLIARNIAFYDPRRNVPPVSKTRSKRRASLHFSLLSSRELVAKLRGQTFSGY